MLSLIAKPVVEKLHEEIRERVRAFTARTGRAPRLSVVLVGEDPASVIYTRRKGEAAVKVGMEHETIRLPATARPDEVRGVVHRLNGSPEVDGILVQRPLPAGFQEEEVLYWVTPEKDVDAFHPANAGRLLLGLPCFQPCTPAGIMEILRHYGIDPSGKIACVIGRSSIVGKPMAALLLQANATVLHCHSRTPRLPELSRQADLVIAAIGKPRIIGPGHIRDGATVIDVGMNRLDSGKLVGDVDFEAVQSKAAAITPVPGGVGPMTIAVLLKNTVWAAERRAREPIQ